MKKVKLVIAILAISLSTLFTAEAADKTPVDSKKVLRTKIMSLLGNEVPFILESQKKLEVEISFVLNKKNEVVIMSVDSSNDEVTSFIKGKLNYKTVKVKGIKKGKVYRVPLKIKQA